MRDVYKGITDFIFMEDDIEKADVILIPGCSQSQLIKKAAELYKQGYANYILPSGGHNKKLIEFDTEFDFLKAEALKLGVPDHVILKEDRATNTFENARFSFDVLKAHKIEVNKVIIVCKTYHARRSYMTYKINFPSGIQFIMQPVLDDRNIHKENWIRSEEKTAQVMTEVVKIGKYFEAYIPDLR